MTQPVPKQRPLNAIEETALIRSARIRKYACRRIGRHLAFRNLYGPAKLIIVNKDTMQWRETTIYADGVGLVTLAQFILGWSKENTIRRLAQKRRTERLRQKLQSMVETVERAYIGRDLSEDAQRFVSETKAIIEEFSVIRWDLYMKARDKFVGDGLGYDQRFDELYERVPGGSSEVYEASGRFEAYVRKHVR